jgi:hypothetical protein
MNRHFSRPVVLTALCLGLSLAGCTGSPFGNLGETLGAQIATGDTTLLVGDVASFTALALYRAGPGFPDSVVWTSSDESVVTVTALPDLQGRVSALGQGTAWVRALVNLDFLDSASVTVVANGEVRWRVPAPAGLALYAAVGSDSVIRVVDASGMLSLYDIAGDTDGPLPSCNGAFGPSLSAATVHVTGNECTRRHTDIGTIMWTVPIGDAGGGVAVFGDESSVILHSLVDGGGATGAVAVSRVSFEGAELWRDTLRALPLEQGAAPAIATNGDIFVAWRAPADSSWLTRLTAAGVERWTMPLPDWAQYTSPALGVNRIVVTHLGGVTEFDTAGAVVWSRQFTQDNPAATSQTAPSSAVISRAGTVYVQTVHGLHAYTAAGAPLWTADSLGGGSQTSGVGAPAILSDTTVVVVVGGSRVCGVHPTQGTPRWCSPTLGAGDVWGGVSVGPDRSVYVMRSSGELIALWNGRGTEFAGWPTEGGNHDRSRRRP